jgi:hypothetical protein
VRLGVITRISGVDFDDCYTRRINVEIDGVSVPFISLEPLKENKRAAGRLKDLQDLEQLSIIEKCSIE